MYFHSEGSVALYKKLYTLISSDTACTANNSSIRYPFPNRKTFHMFFYKENLGVYNRNQHIITEWPFHY